MPDLRISKRSAAAQAASVMKLLQGSVLKSVGTVRNYEQGLTRVAEWLKVTRSANHIKHLTPELAYQYLEQRGQEVGQKTLDMERQAIQSMFINVTGQLAKGETLTVIKSEQQQALKSRAYTSEQAGMVANAQTPRNELSTALAHAAGLRAHELFTLIPQANRPADQRPALVTKWQGREGVIYTVAGKGGLVREVLIPHPLAERLETIRLPTPITITDRGIHYTQHYKIAGGKNWSNSFSAASNRALYWSAGAHGLRHSYAQERMNELQSQGLTRNLALETVSQEMGHFRPEITETYLR
jgi:integrase